MMHVVVVVPRDGDYLTLVFLLVLLMRGTFNFLFTFWHSCFSLKRFSQYSLRAGCLSQLGTFGSS